MPAPCSTHRALKLALLVSAALVLVVGQLDPNAPWPTSGYNNQRTSRTLERGPAKAKNLTVLWPYAPPGQTPKFIYEQGVFSAPVISSHNLVIFGDASGVLTAMNINYDPALPQWTTNTGSPIKSTPSLSLSSVFVVTSTSLWCGHILNGTERWRYVDFAGDALINNSPALSNGTVYVVSSKNLWAILENGAKLWSLPALSGNSIRWEIALSLDGRYLHWVEHDETASEGDVLRIARNTFSASPPSFSCTLRLEERDLDLWGPSIGDGVDLLTTYNSKDDGTKYIAFINISSASLDLNVCPTFAREQNQMCLGDNLRPMWQPAVLNSNVSFTTADGGGRTRLRRCERGWVSGQPPPLAPQKGSWDRPLEPPPTTPLTINGVVQSAPTISEYPLSWDRVLDDGLQGPVVYAFHKSPYDGGIPCGAPPSPTCPPGVGIPSYASHSETLSTYDSNGNLVFNATSSPPYSTSAVKGEVLSQAGGAAGMQQFSAVTIHNGCAYVGSLKGGVYQICDPQTATTSLSTSPSRSPLPSRSGSVTQSVSATQRPSPSLNANATRTPTTQATATVSPSTSSSSLPSRLRTPSGARSGSGNATTTASGSPSPTLSPSVSSSATQLPSLSAVWPSVGNATPTAAASETPTGSHSVSDSASASPSHSPTASGSPSSSGSPSLSHSTTPSTSGSHSLTPSLRPSDSASALPSPTPSLCPSTSTSPLPSHTMPTLTPGVPCLRYTHVPVCDYGYANPGTLTSSASPHASPSHCASAQPSPSAAPTPSGSASPSNSGNGSNSTTASASPAESPPPAPSPAYAAGATSFAGGERLPQSGVLLAVLGSVGGALAAGALWAWHRRQAAALRARALARAKRAAEERAGGAQRRPAPQQQAPRATASAASWWHLSLSHWMGGRHRALQHSVVRSEAGGAGGGGADAGAGAVLQLNPLHTQVPVGGGVAAAGEPRLTHRRSPSAPHLGERERLR